MTTPHAETVQIDLDKDAAIVLFELLAAREEELVRTVQLEVPERNALWFLEGALEKKLVEPFKSNYAEILAAARDSLAVRGGL